MLNSVPSRLTVKKPLPLCAPDPKLAPGGWAEIRPALRSPRILLLHVASGLLLSINWLTYVWGVNNDRVLEASLGYFLVPLGQVSMGMLFLGERPSGRDWAGIVLILSGVGLLVLKR